MIRIPDRPATRSRPQLLEVMQVRSLQPVHKRTAQSGTSVTQRGNGLSNLAGRTEILLDQLPEPLRIGIPPPARAVAQLVGTRPGNFTSASSSEIDARSARGSISSAGPTAARGGSAPDFGAEPLRPSSRTTVSGRPDLTAAITMINSSRCVRCSVHDVKYGSGGTTNIGGLCVAELVVVLSSVPAACAAGAPRTAKARTPDTAAMIARIRMILP